MARHVIVLCGVGLALLGTLALGASAQTSCSEWYPICRQRCVAQNINCNHCDELRETCKRTGCWREGKNYGNRLHCKLKKS